MQPPRGMLLDDEAEARFGGLLRLACTFARAARLPRELKSRLAR